MKVADSPPRIDTLAAIYPFDHPHDVPARTLGNLLGGKGAGLAEMTATLGINVPPGFTVSLPVCRHYRSHGWPPELDDAMRTRVAELGRTMGRQFGDPADPLLVAVRSGSPVSMPGMLDTVLNLGLNDETVLGLAERSGDDRFAWDTYRRFLMMYATTVLGVDPGALPACENSDASVGELREVVEGVKVRVEEQTGRQVPDDPFQQLKEAVVAVFDSWDSERARTYRRVEGISEELGTAVNIQAMVFGNRGPRSGTGVVFTRNPSTGVKELYGDYLPRAQGEDVVAGKARTMPLAELGAHLPEVYAELKEVLHRLELHYRDMCDVEFTLEEGRLWLLQTRVGKRAAVAAVRTAVELVRDPHIRLHPREALARVPLDVRDRARQEIVKQQHESGDNHLLDSGLGASAGRVVGRAVLTSDAAADAEDDVILVRAETSPEDIAGMAASVGILTTRGGLVSHAAVVARGWGIPAVVGAHGLSIVDDTIRAADGTVVRAGDLITIDGTTGQVWVGDATGSAAAAAHSIDEHLPELAVLEAWAQEHGTSDATGKDGP